MLPLDIHRQVRLLQFRARRALAGPLGGEYRSAFRGVGLTFEEVREYQPGDDIRRIDWNVTARMGHPYVKRYLEERELTIILLVDWSGSQNFGTQMLSKRQVTAEMAAVLAFSAIANNDRVGLVGFTDRIERFVPPRKGLRHALRLVRDLLFISPKGRKTSIAGVLEFLHRVLRRRAVVFLLSDFLDTRFEHALRRAGRRHDFVAICVGDPRERALPKVGLVELEDSETGQHHVIDTKSQSVRDAFAKAAEIRRRQLRALARSAEIDWVEADTTGGHLEELVKFFRRRNQKMRSQ
jgi:uncharacterized protein (DUF58 family)